MIIIGGKNCSITKKLYELSKTKCNNTIILETVNDLDVDMREMIELVRIM